MTPRSHSGSDFTCRFCRRDDRFPKELTVAAEPAFPHLNLASASPTIMSCPPDAPCLRRRLAQSLGQHINACPSKLLASSGTVPAAVPLEGYPLAQGHLICCPSHDLEVPHELWP